MAEPEHSAACSNHYHEYDRSRNSGFGQLCKRITKRHADITLNNMKDKNTDSRRDQELSVSVSYEFLRGMFIKHDSRADSCNDIEHRHYPRINEIHKSVVVLNA